MSADFEALRDALSGVYAIDDELGRGGMATVYRARDLRHDRPVALKVLHRDTGVGSERFLREIRTAAALSHPNILPVFDSGSASGFLYYTMPLVEGESLRGRLQRETQLPLADALRIAREVADALGYAHAHNVIHRDIKPENILLHDGHASVADFGIAGAIVPAEDERLTSTGIVVGTPNYMSPEQASGDRRLDGRTDVYSLACVVYEMLSGEPPHSGPTPQAVLARQLKGEVRSLTPLRSSVSGDLDAVVRRGLAPAPADRYRSAPEFVAALDAATHGDAVPSAGARLGRHRVVRLTVLGAAVALLALAGRRMLRGGGHGRSAAVAIFPFRTSGAGVDEWTEYLPDLLATSLDGTPGLPVADPWSLWHALRPDRAERARSPDPDEAAQLAKRAGAATFLLGAVVQTGERVVVTARLYASERANLVHTFSEATVTDSLPALVERLAVGIVGQLTGEPGPHVDAHATDSLEALKAYLAAREAMRRGLVDSADIAIDRAVALDSNFALALVTAVSIKSWRQSTAGQAYTGLLPLAERAVQASDSLGERERLRARAVLASIRTDGAGVADATRRILERDSTDIQALDLLGYSHLSYGWQYGMGEQEARAVSERVLRVDSLDVPALVRRSFLAAAADDSADVQHQIRRLVSADTTNALIRSALLSLRALQADSEQFRKLVDAVSTGPVAEWLAVFRTLRSFSPDRAEQLATRLETVAGPGVPQRTALGASIQLAMAEGRQQEVDSIARSGAYRPFPGLATQVNLLFVASAIAGVGDSSITQRGLRELVGLVPIDSASAYFETRPVWWAGWSIAAYNAMFGDSTVTRRWRAVIGSLPAGGTSDDYRGALQNDLDSRLAARRGDLQTALSLSERAFDLWTIHANNTLESQPEPAMRFHLATLLRATGRTDSAAALLRSLVPPTTWMGFYTTRASLELGEIAEAAGDRAAAARYYGMAASLWRRGGPEVATWRDRAVQGLRRATSEPSSRAPSTQPRQP